MRILVYHSIDNNYNDPYSVPPGLFERQMSWLYGAGYRVTSAEDGFGCPGEDKTVCLTFDDGYDDNYSAAMPILRKYGFTATIYVVTAYIGQYNKWDQDPRNRKPLLTEEQIQEMERHGIRFGSHTQTHADFRKLTSSEITADLSASRARLSQILAKPVESFSYPWGAWRSEHPKLVQEAGYKFAVAASTYGRNALPRDQFRLSRMEISSTDTEWRFACKVRGFFFWKKYESKVLAEWDWLNGRLRQL